MVMTFLYQLIWIFNKDIITSKLAIINMLRLWILKVILLFIVQYMYLVSFFFNYKKN